MLIQCKASRVGFEPDSYSYEQFSAEIEYEVRWCMWSTDMEYISQTRNLVFRKIECWSQMV